jgi:hypothetical protein
MAARHEWHSLYIPLEDPARVADALAAALAGCGFTLYDPFPGGTSLSFGWQERVRCFVAPSQGGWTRVLGACPPEALPALAAALEVNLLVAWLDEEGGGVNVWTPEGCDHDGDALAGWLRPDASALDLRQAMEGDVLAPVLPQEGASILTVPLSPDLQALADRVDDRAAEKLMDRLTTRLFGKPGRGGLQARDAALGMLGGIPWNDEAGRRVRAVLGCLSVPENWREPGLEALSEAYQVARARRHNPAGLRLPGDDVALAAVPDALAYLPVYAGRREEGEVRSG